jgi:capsular exopolysaccharide synthesis family protein
MTTLETYRGGGEIRDPLGAPPHVEAPRKPDNIDFGWLVATFRRRVWTFVITFVLTVAAVCAFMIFFPPIYTGTARVAINQNPVSTTPEKETPVVSNLPVVSNDVDTETQLIQSRRVAGLVVDRLHLDRDPEFAGSHVSLKKSITNFFLSFFHKPKHLSQRDKIIDNVLGNLDPERFLETNAIDINYKDHDPAKAQRIANAFAQAYLDDQVQGKARRNREATAALLSQLEDMRQEAANEAAKVDAYKIAHNLLSVGSQTLTEQEVSGFDQAVATAKAEAAADQANLKTAQEQLARGSNGEDIGEALSSPVVTALRAQRAVLSGKLADLEAHYGPKYPDLAQARRQLADLDQEIQSEIHRTVSNLTAKANISEKRVASLEATRDSTKGELAANNAAQAGLDNLQRAATASEAIYEAYLGRFKEASAQVPSLAPDAEIVSRAGLPDDPSFPIMWLFLLLGVVAGLLFGCAAVLIAEMLETRMATAEDVEQKLGRPYLGGIPLLSSVLKASRLSPLDIVVSEPMSVYSEAFRGLLASVDLGGSDGGPRVALITSALPAEGKTTIAASLARTASRQGVSTVLIDCDVRGRGLTRGLKIDERAPGLIQVLMGEADLTDSLLIDSSSGAMILPMGHSSTPSDDLLSGEAMDTLLASLRENYDAVILDSTSLQIAAARRLAAKADAIVLVARWRDTVEAGLRAALRSLPVDHAPLVGVVLNRIDMAEQAKYGSGTPGHFYQKFKRYYA